MGRIIFDRIHSVRASNWTCRFRYFHPDNQGWNTMKVLKMECEYCGHEIFEDAYRILGIVKNSEKVVVHHYCKNCGEELISEYKRQGKWIIEN